MLTGGITVLTADQMRAADDHTINRIGIPGIVLMENAGRAVVDTIEEFFESPYPMRVAVFCGKGNNGGDGFVIARHLAACGHEPVIYLFTTVDSLLGDALTNARIADSIGLSICEVPDGKVLSEVDYDPRDYQLIVDALFGTGLTSAVRGHYLGAIDLINSSGLPVVAVDIPSGIGSDSGKLLGPAVRADITVTFAYPKIGLVLPPAANYAGQVVIADISIPEDAAREDWKTFLLTDEVVEYILPERELNTHKGTYGHVLVVAGGPGKCGAGAMVGGSALMTGSGLVTIGIGSSLVNTVDAMMLETMTIPLAEEEGYLCLASIDGIMAALKDMTALALGPGIGTKDCTVKLVQQLVPRLKTPAVLDADAVNAFADSADKLKNRHTELIITPHPGEMARLLGVSTNQVQADRISVARKLAVDNGVIVVLKGFRTVVADPSGEVYINMSGNPGMATAGSGDVLTGMIAAFLGMDNFAALEAAVAAVYLHGIAGDLAAEEVGEYCLNASDIMNAIPGAFHHILGEDEA
jgi:NAD(P)H-hydrate epimerase